MLSTNNLKLKTAALGNIFFYSSRKLISTCLLSLDCATRATSLLMDLIHHYAYCVGALYACYHGAFTWFESPLIIKAQLEMSAIISIPEFTTLLVALV
jgi:hypothetical protein